jgi:hypothetical protein
MYGPESKKKWDVNQKQGPNAIGGRTEKPLACCVCVGGGGAGVREMTVGYFLKSTTSEQEMHVC